MSQHLPTIQTEQKIKLVIADIMAGSRVNDALERHKVSLSTYKRHKNDLWSNVAESADNALAEVSSRMYEGMPNVIDNLIRIASTQEDSNMMARVTAGRTLIEFFTQISAEKRGTDSDTAGQYLETLRQQGQDIADSFDVIDSEPLDG